MSASLTISWPSFQFNIKPIYINHLILSLTISVISKDQSQLAACSTVYRKYYAYFYLIYCCPNICNKCNEARCFSSQWSRLPYVFIMRPKRYVRKLRRQHWYLPKSLPSRLSNLTQNTRSVSAISLQFLGKRTWATSARLLYLYLSQFLLRSIAHPSVHSKNRSYILTAYSKCVNFAAVCLFRKIFTPAKYIYISIVVFVSSHRLRTLCLRPTYKIRLIVKIYILL